VTGVFVKKWTQEKLRDVIEVLTNHTDYQKALQELGETQDSMYNAFQRAGLSKPTEYLATDPNELARREKLSSDPDLVTLLVGNDFHIPFHNEAGCRNFLKFSKDLQPDHIVLNGDVLDCYSLSRFPKAPGMPDLQEEIDIGVEFLSELRTNCPLATIDYLEGNHEERLKRIVKEQHSLYGLRALTLPKLLFLDDLQIKYHSYCHPVDFNGNMLSIVHGHKVSKDSGASAKSHLLGNGFYNVIIGHTHRMGLFYHTGHMGCRRGYENGGLFCKKKLEYVVEPNWQNGFCVVYMLRSDPSFLQIVPIEMTDDGTFVWQGVVYKG
jgi:predicted phosphodiesterase